MQKIKSPLNVNDKDDIKLIENLVFESYPELSERTVRDYAKTVYQNLESKNSAVYQRRLDLTLDDQQIKDLINNLIAEEMPFRPKLTHGFATANAEIAKDTLFMLINGDKEEIIEKKLFSLYGYTQSTAHIFVERAVFLLSLLKEKYPNITDNSGKIRNVTPRKKSLSNNKLKALSERKETTPAIHVNPDGSVVEMDQVLAKEEKEKGA